MEQRKDGHNCIGSREYDPDNPECTNCKDFKDCGPLQWLADLGFGKSPNLIPVFNKAWDEVRGSCPDDQKKQGKFIVKAINKWIDARRAALRASANELPQKVKIGSRDWPLAWHRDNPKIERMLYRTHLHDVVNYIKRHFATIGRSDKLADLLREARRKPGHKKGCGCYCYYDEQKGTLVKRPLVYFIPDYRLAEFGTLPPPPPGSDLPYRPPLGITALKNGRPTVVKMGMKKASLQKTIRQAAKAGIFPCFGKVEENGPAIYAFGYQTKSWVKDAEGDSVEHRTRHLFVRQNSYWAGVLEGFKCGENGQSRK